MLRSLRMLQFALLCLFLLRPAQADAHGHFAFVTVNTGLGGHVVTVVPTNDVFDYGFGNPFLAAQLAVNPSITFQVEAIRGRDAVNAAILAAELERRRPRPIVIIRP